MTRDEATTILAGLTAAFPNARLEDATPDVWRKHLAPLDFDVAGRAVGQCVNHLKFFPSVAEFREFYRLERHNSPPKPTPEPESSEIPTWVHVWHWHRLWTELDRQAANTSASGPIEDRPPVRMRMFPQESRAAREEDLTREWREMSGSTAFGRIVLSTSVPPNPEEANAYTFAEYQDLERDWIAAGSPKLGSATELVEGAVCA